MRKDDILIFSNRNKINYMKYLMYALNKNILRKTYSKLSFSINNYNIKVFDDIDDIKENYYRCHKPEICYIQHDINVYKNSDAWCLIMANTEMYSNRITPVRFINGFEDIDIQELVDDDYALKNTISKERMKKWDSWNLNS